MTEINNKIIINEKEIQYETSSGFDLIGKIFYYKGKVFRKINSNKKNTVKKILTICQENNIFEKGLIETKIADISINDDLILEHKKILFTTYFNEWSGLMYKDAALCIINLFIELDKHNLTLKDTHPWNIMFDAHKPTFIDFGSIIEKASPKDKISFFKLLKIISTLLKQRKETGYSVIIDKIVTLLKKDKQSGYFEFIETFILPLYLFSRKAEKKLHSSLQPIFFSLSIKDVWGYLGILEKISFIFFFTLCTIIWSGGQKYNALLFNFLLIQINSIKIKPKKTSWSNYEKNKINFENQDNWNEKRKTIYTILKKYKPKTVLDIASNVGWFSILAHKLGSTVVSFDIDETSINKLYLEVKKNNYKIFPLIMDFLIPTYPSYRYYPYEANVPYRQGAPDRLKCDMVIALAVIHHTVFKRKRLAPDFEIIVKTLNSFCNKILILEFIDRDDPFVKNWITEDQTWYTLENLINVLNKYFYDIEIFDSNEPSRKLLVCKKNL